MSKSETFINRPQPGTGSFAIKPHKVAVEFAGTLRGPAEQCMRDHAAGKTPSNGKAMNIGRLSLRHIRPEFFVFELKLDYPGHFTVGFSYEAKPGGNVGRYSFRKQFVIPPHRHLALTQPGCGFQKNVGHCFCIRDGGLLNMDFHYSLTGIFFSAKNFFTSPTV